MIWMAVSVGRPAARALLYPICVYYVLFSRHACRAIQPYLIRALGRPIGRRDLYQQFLCFASTLLDRVYLLTGQASHFDIDIRGLDVLKDHLVRGQGCILLGSHLGSFEIVRAIGLSQRDVEIKVLMHEQHTPMIRDLFRDLNPEVADSVIQTGSPNTMLQVKECLDRGGVVGILADRLVNQNQATDCRFLGKLARFPAGTMWLASVLKVPVILFFGLYRGGNRYEIHFERLVDAWPASRVERKRTVAEAQREYVARLEHHCRDAPYNWYNFYDFWK